MSIQNKHHPSSTQRNSPVRALPVPSEQRPYRKRALQQPRGYRATKMLFLALVLATLFVAMRGNLWKLQQLPQSHKAHLRIVRTPTGPFLTPPFSIGQINALRNRDMSNLISYKRLAQAYVAHMTLDEELGQLFMAEYYDTSYSPALDTMIRKLHAGGVIMYAFQMKTFAQTKHDISEMKKNAKIPLIISADEEGGFVERVQHIYGHRPGALETYQTGKPEKAAQLGRSIAHDLLALGINEDLAPDVDVQLVNGPDQYLRTWGYTPRSVITYAGAYMRAIQGDGVIACIKHFPGLGAAQTDAHFDLPVVKRTRTQLYAVELAPFKAFIRSHDPGATRNGHANRCIDASY